MDWNKLFIHDWQIGEVINAENSKTKKLIKTKTWISNDGKWMIEPNWNTNFEDYRLTPLENSTELILHPNYNKTGKLEDLMKLEF